MLQQNFYERDKYSTNNKKTKSLNYHEEAFESDSSQDYLEKKRIRNSSNFNEEKLLPKKNTVYHFEKNDSQGKMIFNHFLNKDKSFPKNNGYSNNYNEIPKQNNNYNKKNYDNNNRDYNSNYYYENNYNSNKRSYNDDKKNGFFKRNSKY